MDTDDYPNTATLTGPNTDLSRDAEVTVSCTLDALVPSKTAEASYGRTVTWEGQLHGVDPYTYDFVFGNGPAVKLNVEVHDLGSDVYGGRRVDAIVSVEGDAEALRARMGEEIRFSGRLLRCDSLMRNVFVAEASLL